jgi:hypothetical protein
LLWKGLCVKPPSAKAYHFPFLLRNSLVEAYLGHRAHALDQLLRAKGLAGFSGRAEHDSAHAGRGLFGSWIVKADSLDLGEGQSVVFGGAGHADGDVFGRHYYSWNGIVKLLVRVLKGNVG